MKKKVRKYLIPDQENDYTPHLFRGISTAVLTGLVVLLLVISVSSSIIFERSGLLGAIYPAVLVDLANEARVESRYQPLTIDEKLTRAAQLKANDMAEKSYFAHNSPEGLSPWYWIGLSGYQFLYAGENLAVDFSYSKDVNRAWLNSPGHAANILSPNFTQIGIATAEGTYNGRKTTFVVQMFGTPVPPIKTDASQSVAGAQTPVIPVAVAQSPTPAPTPAPKPEVEPTPEPQVEIIEETQTEDRLFIVAQNAGVDVSVFEEQEAGQVEPSDAPGYETYSRWYDWMVLNPALTIEYALYAAAALIAFALIIMVFVNIHVQRPRNLLYGMFVLTVLLVVIYLNRLGIMSEFVSRYFL